MPRPNTALGISIKSGGAERLNADADGEPDFKQAEHWFRESAQRGWIAIRN